MVRVKFVLDQTMKSKESRQSSHKVVLLERKRPTLSKQSGYGQRPAWPPRTTTAGALTKSDVWRKGRKNQVSVKHAISRRQHQPEEVISKATDGSQVLPRLDVPLVPACSITGRGSPPKETCLRVRNTGKRPQRQHPSNQQTSFQSAGRPSDQQDVPGHHTALPGPSLNTRDASTLPRSTSKRYSRRASDSKTHRASCLDGDGSPTKQSRHGGTLLHRMPPP